MLKIVEHIGNPSQSAVIHVAPGHTLFIVTEGVRAVGWFDNRDDAEFFVRTKEAAFRYDRALTEAATCIICKSYPCRCLSADPPDFITSKPHNWASESN